MSVKTASSLSFSKIRGEKRKTSKRASLSVSVMCDFVFRRSRYQRLAASLLARHGHSHARTLVLRSSPRILVRESRTARSQISVHLARLSSFPEIP